MNNTPQTYEIECPKCNTRQQVGIYQSVSSANEPRLKELLLKNQINIVDCVNCEYIFRIDAPMVYRDEERNVAILCLPIESDALDSFDEPLEEHFKSMQSALQSDLNSPHVELVFTHSELIERIFILDCDMDARIIEYLKYIMHTRNPEKLDPEKKRILFNADQSNEVNLLFVVQDMNSRELEGVLEYSRNAYNELDALFDNDDLTPDLMEMFPGPHVCARKLLISEQAS